MVDLHCHILPGIDDGAKDLAHAVALVKSQIADGITAAAATPHFDIARRGIDDFLEKRAAAHAQLSQALAKEGMAFAIKPAAEVQLRPSLLEVKGLERLCIEGTSYMLVELPYDLWPTWVRETLYRLHLQGITPIIAHIEKYQPVALHPECLYNFIQAEMLIQINADSLLGGFRLRTRLMDYVRRGIVHVIATDTHAVGWRPPRLGDAMRLVEKKAGAETVENIAANALAVFGGQVLELPEPVHRRWEK